MRSWAWLALGVALVATVARSADYKTLRYLNAPAPVQLEPIAKGVKTRPVQFAKAVIAPRNGEAWALAYYSFGIDDPDSPRPRLGLLSWNSGRIQADTASFARIFDEEAAKAGFSVAGSDSLFGDGDSGADLKLGVLIDDLKGRFCADCPNLLNRDGIPASVVMTANWEVYSTLDRKVVASVTTSGGADYKSPLQGSFLPAIYAGFRENVRLLLANQKFRALVSRPAGAQGLSVATPLPALHLVAGSAHLTRARATDAVVIVFAADGSGSGFLISSDGYLLTNQHVVGASKYVKLKWNDGSETLGEVVRSDVRRDVALIKTDTHNRTPLDLRSGPVQQGEPVYAIGTPIDDTLQNTMTRGIVSANRIDDGQPFIQSDVAVTHGNSGGPLLDEKGQVIGMTVSGRAPNGSPIGLNFFIPIDDALRALALTPAAPSPSATVALAPTRAHSARKP